KVNFIDITVVLSANYNTGQTFGPAAASSLTGGGHTASAASTAIAEATTVGVPGDGKVDFEYNPVTGDVKFRPDGAIFQTTGGANSFVSSILLQSDSGILKPGGASAAMQNTAGFTGSPTQVSGAILNNPGFTDG